MLNCLMLSSFGHCSIFTLCCSFLSYFWISFTPISPYMVFCSSCDLLSALYFCWYIPPLFSIFSIFSCSIFFIAIILSFLYPFLSLYVLLHSARGSLMRHLLSFGFLRLVCFLNILHLLAHGPSSSLFY